MDSCGRQNAKGVLEHCIRRASDKLNGLKTLKEVIDWDNLTKEQEEAL
jgi:hypothetical protein